MQNFITSVTKLFVQCKLDYVNTKVHISLFPSHSQLFNAACWKVRGPGIQNHVRDAPHRKDFIARGQVKGQLILDSSRSHQVSNKGAMKASECGAILLVCRYEFNDKPKYVICEQQAISFVSLF